MLFFMENPALPLHQKTDKWRALGHVCSCMRTHTYIYRATRCYDIKYTVLQNKEKQIAEGHTMSDIGFPSDVPLTGTKQNLSV